MKFKGRLKVVGYIDVECDADDETDARETFLMIDTDELDLEDVQGIKVAKILELEEQSDEDEEDEDEEDDFT